VYVPMHDQLLSISDGAQVFVYNGTSLAWAGNKTTWNVTIPSPYGPMPKKGFTYDTSSDMLHVAVGFLQSLSGVAHIAVGKRAFQSMQTFAFGNYYGSLSVDASGVYVTSSGYNIGPPDLYGPRVNPPAYCANTLNMSCVMVVCPSFNNVGASVWPIFPPSKGRWYFSGNHHSIPNSQYFYVGSWVQKKRVYATPPQLSTRYGLSVPPVFVQQ
jgi:hypothetical protein